MTPDHPGQGLRLAACPRAGHRDCVFICPVKRGAPIYHLGVTADPGETQVLEDVQAAP